jgi:hypothetical protein
MSYNLGARVDRLERQRPSNPYENMTDEELQARVDRLKQEFLTAFWSGPRNTRGGKGAE